MRMSMLLGATLGFVTGMAAGFMARNAWPVVLWHAAVGALVVGILARWWASVWQSSLRHTLTEGSSKTGSQRKPVPSNTSASKV